MGILKAPVATRSSLAYESVVRVEGQYSTKQSLPAANPASEHFHDDFAFFGVSPWDIYLLKLTSLLEEGVGGVDIWVWDGQRHWGGRMLTSGSLLHAVLYGPGEHSSEQTSTNFFDGAFGLLPSTAILPYRGFNKLEWSPLCCFENSSGRSPSRTFEAQSLTCQWRDVV